MDSIIHTVRTHYAIDIRELKQQKGGWASLAYKVHDGKTPSIHTKIDGKYETLCTRSAVAKGKQLIK